MEKEIRTIPIDLELRRDGQNNPVLFGRAAVYNSMSNDLGGFKEIIEPGFFSGVLDGDIIATIEHNCEKIVGRTSAGTLKITDSDEALLTENNIPPTSVGKDLAINIERGEIKQMSFAFTVKPGGDEWKTSNGVTTRTLRANGCSGLYDVTYTSRPAYSDTSIAMRSLEKHIEETKEPETDPDDDFAKTKPELLKRRLDLVQL